MSRRFEPHLLRLEQDRAVLRLLVPLDWKAVQGLVDEVELLLGYYKYSDIRLEIDSPGGDASAMQYLLDRVAYWQRYQDLRLSTVALGEVGSAAAVLLSSGTVGHRRAYASARLLYHTSRVITKHQQLTGSVLHALTSELARFDRRIVEHLAEHAFQAAPGPVTVRLPEGSTGKEHRQVSAPAELADIYMDVFARDSIISPADAIGLRLIDGLERPLLQLARPE